MIKNKKLMQEEIDLKQITKLKYSSLTKRFIAFLIDILLLYLSVFIILKFGLTFQFNSKTITPGMFYLILWYLFVVYLLFFNIILNGQTLGYKLMQIRLVSLQGDKANIWQYIIRSIFISVMAVPILNQLVLLIATTWLVFSLILLLTPSNKECKQMLWDLTTKTCVINIKK